MSETTQTPSAEQIAARQAKEQAVNKRIEELKAYAGKSFVAADGSGGLEKIISYGGIAVKDNQAEYTFIVEGHGYRYTPAATNYLATHVEVDPKTFVATKHLDVK